MIKSLIVKTLLLPTVAGGAYLAGSHGELPTALAGDAPTAPATAPTTPAQVPQVAGQVAVSIEITDDGKVVARQVPQAPGKAPQAVGKAPQVAPDTRVGVVVAPAPAAGPQEAAESPAAQVTTPAPAATPSATPTQVPPFANCSAVRAAGKAPIHTGEPGWSDKLDRNHDGKAC